MVPDGSVVSAHAGERWFLGEVPTAATRADEGADPIVLGLVNQEDPVVGSYAEVRAAVEAVVRWVNAELGGVEGRPLALRTCTITFDVERSRACATELVAAGVDVFVGGVDVASDGSLPVIERNDLVTVGGIPATLAQQRSPATFFFSGGDAGALAAFMSHAAAMGATTVAVAYGQEAPSFEVAARDYGAAVGRSLGLDVHLLPYSVLSNDHEDLLTSARDVGADAVVVLAATAACSSVLKAAERLDLDSQLYLTGACAGEETLAEVGDAAVGVIFNAEGPVDGTDVDASLYRDVVDRYAEEPAGGAGTVAFRGAMNLYALLLQAGPDRATSEVVAELARASVARPSFWGHPYTCDGEQVPGLPALCAPQQLLFTVPADGAGYVSVTGWIETDRLFVEALG
jgi:branched-chain amino acid transport system substrate-binding protein